MVRALLTALLLVLAVPLAAGAEGIADRWTKFKAGSFVTIRTTSKLSGEEMVEESKYTITELTADYYALKIETSMGGNALPVTEVKYPLTPSAAPEWTWEEKGAEELEIAGEKVKCSVRIGTSSDKKSLWTIWVAEVGGGSVEVKTEKKLVVPGGSRTETSVVTSLSEKLKVGEKEVSCWVKTTLMEVEGQKVEGKVWESRDVPGLVVKSENKTTVGTMVMVSIREVVAFEVK